MFTRTLTIALATTPLAAQDIKVETLTDTSSLARAGTNTILRSIKAGTSVVMKESAPTSIGLPTLSSTAYSNFGHARASFHAGATPTHRLQGKFFVRALTADFRHVGGAWQNAIASTSISPTAATAKPGPITYLVTYNHARDVAGRLHIDWATFTNAEGTFTATVDIGNNGRIDFTADASKDASKLADYAVDFKNGPVTVKVTLLSTATKISGSNSQTLQSLKIAMVKEGRCSLASYGATCNGASLDAALLSLGNHGVFTARLNGAPKNGFLARVIGNGRASMPLPSGCNLLVDGTSMELLQADANGSHTQAFSVPMTTNYTINLQYVPFELSGGGTLMVRTTKGWELSCAGF